MKKALAFAWDKKFKEDILNQQFDDFTKRQLDNFISLLPKGAKVLDVGCGDGRSANYISKRGFGVTGIDSSETAIKFAKEKFPQVKFEHGFVEDMPFRENSFDAVISFAVFHCLCAESRNIFINGVYRLLKPGGISYMITLASEDETISKTNKIEENSFKQKSGVLMHLSTEAEIRELFEKFEIIGIKHLKRKVGGKVNSVFICVMKK